MIIAVSASFYFYYYERPPEDPLDNVLAIVEGNEITQRDLNKQIFGMNFEGSIEEPEEIDEEMERVLLDQLIEWEIINIKADEWEIEIDEEDFENEGKKRLGEERFEKLDSLPEEQRSITREVIENEALVEKVKEEGVEWREGGLVLVRFDKYLIDGIPPGVQEWPSGEEAEQRAKEQREYADKLVEEIYEKLQEGSITFKEAMEKTKKDPVVGEEGFYPLLVPLSQNFTKEEWMEGKGLLQEKDLKENLRETEEGLNEPFVVSTEDYFGKKKESYWVIADISEVNEGISGSYSDWMEELKKEMVDFIDENYEELYDIGNTFFQTAFAAPGGKYCGVDTSKIGIQTGLVGNTAGLIIKTQYYNESGNGPFPLDGVSVTIETMGSHEGSQRGLQDIDVTAFDGSSFGSVYQSAYAQRTFQTGQPWYYAYNSDGSDWGDRTCSTPGELILGYGTQKSYGIQWGLRCSFSPFRVEVHDPSGRTGEWDEAFKTVALTGNGYNTEEVFTWRDEEDENDENDNDENGDPDPEAPDVELIPNPDKIESGESSELIWWSDNTDSCRWTRGLPYENEPTEGTRSVSPPDTTTYEIECEGPEGSASDDATVSVDEPDDEPEEGDGSVSCELALERELQGVSFNFNTGEVGQTTEENYDGYLECADETLEARLLRKNTATGEIAAPTMATWDISPDYTDNVLWSYSSSGAGETSLSHSGIFDDEELSPDTEYEYIVEAKFTWEDDGCEYSDSCPRTVSGRSCSRCGRRCVSRDEDGNCTSRRCRTCSWTVYDRTCCDEDYGATKYCDQEERVVIIELGECKTKHDLPDWEPITPW